MRIQLWEDRASRISITGDGDLQIETPFGIIREKALIPTPIKLPLKEAKSVFVLQRFIIVANNTQNRLGIGTNDRFMRFASNVRC